MGGTRQIVAVIATLAWSGPPGFTEGAAGFEGAEFLASFRGLGKGMAPGAPRLGPWRRRRARPSAQRSATSGHPAPSVRATGVRRSQDACKRELLPPHTPAELSDDLRRRRAEEWRATAAGSPGSTRRRLKVCFQPLSSATRVKQEAQAQKRLSSDSHAPSFGVRGLQYRKAPARCNAGV